MEYKNLENALDRIFGVFSEERTIILNALKKDEELMNKISSSDDVHKIINIFNEVFNKQSRVMSKKVLNKYKEILKHFSLQDINQSMINAKKDDFHLENDYKYCTLEYFSRIEQIDKWLNATKEKKKSDFILPSFNIKG
jgi:anionic cell wall polymer biosynthesis LytR-Cps2A-Psr (LCP) family protein